MKELHLLFLGEETSVRQALLERVDEAVDGAREWKSCQVREVVHAKGRPKALLLKSAKSQPRDVVDTTRVAFEHVVPLLGAICQMERGEPDLGVLTG